MTAAELKKLIVSLTQDIEFEYNGVHGVFLPFARNNIVVCYGDNEQICSESDIMDCTIIGGLPLKTIANDITVR